MALIYFVAASSDSRYRFSNYKSTEFGKFVIKDVDYKDRAVYSCNASNSISFVTMEFTLRVRGELVFNCIEIVCDPCSKLHCTHYTKKC